MGCNSCVSVTGSHSPPDYSGLKMVVGGETLALDAIGDLKRRAARKTGCVRAGGERKRNADVRPPTSKRIIGDVKLARP